jgi:hypothetical protein
MTDLYATFMQVAIGGTGPNLNGGTIKVVLVNIASGHYAVNLATDQFLSAISSGDRVATTADLTGTSITGGTFGAANTSFSSVTGATCGAIVIYNDTGTPSTSQLIMYIDDYAGLPITPDGSNINISWPTGTNLIFTI